MALRKNSSSSKNVRTHDAHEERFIVSRARFEELQQEHLQLTTQGRQEVSEQLEAAKAEGDLSENAGYDEAKHKQGLLEARIRYLEARLQAAEVIDEQAEFNPNAGAAIGVEVVVDEVEGNQRYAYRLVGPEDADPLTNRISHLSPVGEGLLGRRIGDCVRISTPRGVRNLRIVDIRP